MAASTSAMEVSGGAAGGARKVDVIGRRRESTRLALAIGSSGVQLLDGPMGTMLAARGVETPAPGWSVHAIEAAPDAVIEIHREYVVAGATIHRGNTFRAQPRIVPDHRSLAKRALNLLRAGASRGGKVGRLRFVGSMAPIEDCYRPDLSPAEEDARRQHRDVATALADAGFDMILCETFPHAGEAVIAVEEAVETGLDVWVALTAGPDGTLMTPAAMEDAARACVAAGATAVLVNCVAATKTLPFVERLAKVDARFGAYANAGAEADALGWDADPRAAAARYADLAATWIDAGASIIGGCCGTTATHIQELDARFNAPARP